MYVSGLAYDNLKVDYRKAIESMFIMKFDRVNMYDPDVNAAFDVNLGGRFPVILFTNVDVNYMVIAAENWLIVMAYVILGSKQRHRN